MNSIDLAVCFGVGQWNIANQIALHSDKGSLQHFLTYWFVGREPYLGELSTSLGQQDDGCAVLNGADLMT